MGMKKTASAVAIAAIGTMAFGVLPSYAAAITCNAAAATPSFSGSTITGNAGGNCSSNAGSTTVDGRIKEDRPGGQPDAVHQTKSYYPAPNNSYVHFMNRNTCQDGDAIYLEGLARGDSGGKKVAQSSRRTMDC